MTKKDEADVSLLEAFAYQKTITKLAGGFLVLGKVLGLATALTIFAIKPLAIWFLTATWIAVGLAILLALAGVIENITEEKQQQKLKA